MAKKNNGVGGSVGRRSAACALSVALAAGMTPAAAFAAPQGEAPQGVTVAASQPAADAAQYDRANMPDGTYDMTVGLNQAADPDSPSMAGASLDTAAKLNVKDGAYSVDVTLKTMWVMGVRGDITKMGYYTAGYVKDGHAYFQGSATPAEVISTRDTDAGTYPEVVRLPVSAQAIKDGYVLVAVTTTGMSDGEGGPATVNAVVKLDWAEFDAQYGPQEEKADKTNLVAEITAAKAIERGSASAPDWALLQKAIAAAEEVNAAEKPTQRQVDAATASLKAAVDRFNGVTTLAPKDGFFYLTPGSWVQADGSASVAGNFFSDDAEVRKAPDGSFSVRITTTGEANGAISDVTYDGGKKAEPVKKGSPITPSPAAESSAEPTQYELFVASLTKAVEVSYVLNVNGFAITQSGYLVLDTESAIEVAQPSATVDKSALKSGIADAKAVTQGSKEDVAWKALQDAIAGAQATYDDADATQDEVDAAVKSLAEAVEAFKASPDKPAENPFSDIDEGEWFYDSVLKAYSLGYMSGYQDEDGVPTGFFGPYDSTTRAQAAAVLFNYAGAEEPSEGSGFDDVPASGEWYSGVVAWAKAGGVVSGYEGTNLFGPNDTVTREQFAAILFNYAGVSESDVKDVDETLAKYGDAAQVDGWAKAPVAWAVQQGIMGKNTDTNTVNPLDPISRAEMAAMITDFKA